MKATVTYALSKLWWLITKALSESGEISFGRTISAVITLYFLAQDAWLFHRIGHLVDNATLLTQLSVMTAFYASSKGLGIFNKEKSEPGADKQP